MSQIVRHSRASGKCWRISALVGGPAGPAWGRRARPLAGRRAGSRRAAAGAARGSTPRRGRTSKKREERVTSCVRHVLTCFGTRVHCRRGQACLGDSRSDTKKRLRQWFVCYCDGYWTRLFDQNYLVESKNLHTSLHCTLYSPSAAFHFVQLEVGRWAGTSSRARWPGRGRRRG